MNATASILRTSAMHGGGSRLCIAGVSSCHASVESRECTRACPGNHTRPNNKVLVLLERWGTEPSQSHGVFFGCFWTQLRPHAIGDGIDATERSLTADLGAKRFSCDVHHSACMVLPRPGSSFGTPGRAEAAWLPTSCRSAKRGGQRRDAWSGQEVGLAAHDVLLNR